MKQIAFLAALLASTSAAAAEPLALSIATRTPVAIVTHSSGLGTAKASATARVTDESARKQSESFIIDNPDELKGCIAARLKQLPNDQYASANCRAGILRPLGGGSYLYAGEWTEREEPGVTHRTKWRGGDGEIVGTATAFGGLSLAQQCSTLCGSNAKPVSIALRPTHVANTPCVLSARSPAESGLQSVWDHNGSEVWVDPGTGVISYRSPKPSIRRAVAEGSVLFRGNLHSERHVRGTAYAFKDGCTPAPYQVTGIYSRDDGSLVLRGLGPIREGCEVVAYSESSPHAVLKFVSMMSP